MFGSFTGNNFGSGGSMRNSLANRNPNNSGTMGNRATGFRSALRPSSQIAQRIAGNQRQRGPNPNAFANASMTGQQNGAAFGGGTIPNSIQSSNPIAPTFDSVNKPMSGGMNNPPMSNAPMPTYMGGTANNNGGMFGNVLRGGIQAGNNAIRGIRAPMSDTPLMDASGNRVSPLGPDDELLRKLAEQFFSRGDVRF